MSHGDALRLKGPGGAVRRPARRRRPAAPELAAPLHSVRIDAAVAQRRMLDHPFLCAWERGELTRQQLADFGAEYFHLVLTLPPALRSARALCPDARRRGMLAAGLAAARTLGGRSRRPPHAALWLAFATAMGASERDVRTSEPRVETQRLIDTLARLSRRSYASALGALYAYGSQTPEVSATMVGGLLGRCGSERAIVTEIFAEHVGAGDREHARVRRALLDTLTPAQADEALEAAVAMSAALLDFLDGLHRASLLLTPAATRASAPTFVPRLEFHPRAQID